MPLLPIQDKANITMMIGFLAFALAVRATPAAADKAKKNVLFLICDDLRPQLKEAYGQSFMVTPNFDKLARESLVFDYAFTNMARGFSPASPVTLQLSRHSA
jgi:hypothetical protein